MSKDRVKKIGAFGVLWRVILSRIFKRDISICFLKCDAKSCPHIEFWTLLIESMIDKPCPRCGSNLMTKDEFWGVPNE